jgi:superfamily I DNA and RNA helicase
LLRAELCDFDKGTINTFHGYLEESIERSEAGWFDANNTGESEWFEVDVPLKFMDISTSLELKYDTIILDEGQDFNEDWVKLLLEVLNPEGSFLIFSDYNQNIFNRDGEEGVRGFKNYVLIENLRNTKRINSYINETLAIDVLSHRDVPLGNQVLIQTFTLREQAIKYLESEIYRLISKENVNLSQVVILSDVSARRTFLKDYQRIGKYELLPFNEENSKNKNAILYSNPYTFKGLERDVVFCLQESQNTPNNVKYVQLSRAKNLLYHLNISS